jgi:glutaredoxin-like protein
LIPLREQEVIRRRLEDELLGRVRIDYFTQRQSRVVVPGRPDCPHCEDVRQILEELAHLSSRIVLSVHEFTEASKLASELDIDRVPGIVVRGAANRALRFAGIPMGTLFPVFIESIIEAASPGTALKAETVRQLKKLKDEVTVHVFVSPGCRFSPEAALTAWRLALQSPRIKVEVVEAMEYPALAQRLGLRATPAMLIGEKLLVSAGLGESDLVRAVFRVAEGRPDTVSDFEAGPSTPLQFADPQTPARPATSAGGIILPR